MKPRTLSLLVLAGVALLGVAAALVLFLTRGATEDLPTLPGTVLSLARVEDAPEIGPVQPGELLPLDGPAGPGVGILLAGPQGDVEDPRQATVVFDRPMVPLAGLDDPLVTVPLSCGPGLLGKARWAGTSTAVWIPEGRRFPRASDFTCTVPGGATALDGTLLGSDVTFAFRTRTPSVEEVWPAEGSSVLAPGAPILVVFDQPVDPAAVARASVLEEAGGRRLPLTGITPPEDDDDWRLPPDRTRAVHLSAALERDRGYELTVPAGTPAREGTRGTEADVRTSFRTIPPAAITAFEPQGPAVDPYAILGLHFATETEVDAFNGRIHLSPAPPDPWAPAEGYATRHWSHGLRLDPMTPYTVTVDPGASDVHGQSYAEGLSWTFTTGHFEAMLDMPLGPQIFPAGEPHVLPLRTRNLTDLQVALEPVPASWVLSNLSDGSFRATWGSQGVLHLTTTPPRSLADGLAVDDRVHVQQVDLETALTGGRGLVLVEAWSSDLVDTWRKRLQVHRTLLQVTDLGATVKAGPDGLLVWVTRLSDGHPVWGATVEVWRDGRLEWAGTTDNSGLAFAAGKVPKGWRPWSDPLWIVARLDSDQVLTSTESPNRVSTWAWDVWPSDPGHPYDLLHHAYTDRGVYRRGETAHVALTARITGEKGFFLPKVLDASWTCKDASDSPIAEGKATGDEHGALAFDVTLPSTAALGSTWCALDLAADGVESEAHVEIPILAYRPPTFRVDVSAPADLVAGGRLEATGEGRYLFGAPMTGAEATWAVTAQASTPSIQGWDGWAFDPVEPLTGEDGDFPSQETVATGRGTLAPDGRMPVAIEIPVTEEPRTRTYTVEVRVTDAARQEIANRAEIHVHPADAYAGLRLDRGVGQAGDAVGVDVAAVAPSGQALAGLPVSLAVVRRTWDVIRQKGMDGRWTWVSTPNDEPVVHDSVTSGHAARRFSFTPDAAGWYVVRAELQDSEGRRTRTETGLFVAGEDATWARDDSRTLGLVPDRKTYRPGETARVLVRAPRPGLRALVTVEREGVLSRRTVQLETTADTLEIPIGEDEVPNVYLSVVAVEGAPPTTGPDSPLPAFYMGYLPLDVDPAGRKLEVALSTDAASYQPGQEVRATVTVTQGGVPSPRAHVVLWAVDHGVLSLTGYATPDPFSAYYVLRPLKVVTADSRTSVLDRQQYLAKGAPVGGGGGLPGLRSRFETTPIWLPSLVTSTQGTVTATFTLPDDLTTFRLMAVADAGTGAFGSGDREIQVTRPLVASPALPRVLRVGDRALAGVVVHNHTGADREVRVQAEAEGLVLAPGQRTVRVLSNAAQEVPFDLSAKEAGLARLTFTVTAGSDRDAVRVTLPVVRPAPVEVVATAGSTLGTATERIVPPADASPGVGGLDVEVAPTVLVGIEQAADWILSYPWSCLEQVSSRLLAAVRLREIAPRAGLALDRSDLDARITAELGRLPGYRHPSGGYTLWPDGWGGPAAVATAYALEAAQAAGQSPDPEALRFLRAFLSGRWVPSWWEAPTLRSARVRVALSLARIGAGDAATHALLYGERTLLGVRDRAALAEAIARTTGPDQRTEALLSALEGLLVVDADIARVRPADRETAFWGGTTVATAGLLEALLVARPDHPLADRLARGLVSSRRAGRWDNTYASQAAFSALASYARLRETGGTPRATVRFGSRTLLEGPLDPGRPRSTSLPMGSFPEGDLVVEADGGRIYYEARLGYGLPEMPPRDEGFTLARTYTLVEGTGGEHGVVPGALVRVVLRVTTPVERTDVLLEDALPAGLEPVETRFRTTASAIREDLSGDPGFGDWVEGEEGEASGTWWSDAVFDHRSMEDAGVAFHASIMPPGIHVTSYLARATTPGDYALPAATVQEMYRPEVFGRTSGDRFVVGSGAVARASE
ncbi:MAG: Ig-like domain-containing protein [Deltaproteobacteria bacterium]|nr:Ig-like domain-containing protein [Deltaproteobacteria bacterium]